MSTFVNPFSQFGDYQNNVAQKDEIATSSYLTGLPDPRQMADEQARLIFKQLLKRDSRTKLRAMREFESWLGNIKEGGEIEDTVHLGWVQMYAKLSIDSLVEIRQLSHIIIDKLYKVLGKLSSKYLKYSVGPWLTSVHDPDIRASRAAQSALDSVFPGNKQSMLVDKMRTSILDYILDSFNNATAQTLSDSRYFTKEEASQKYTRLIKCCIDTMVNVSQLFDLSNPDIIELIGDGKLWKFFSSSDSAVARSALRLASAHVNELHDYILQVWKELLRSARKNTGGPSVSLEVLQLMNVLTKTYGEIIWPADVKSRNDSFASLAQFVHSDPPHSAKFWPMFYNLVLLVPEPPQRDLTPLYKPLEKLVLQLKHNTEVEESAWGCYISLAGKMGSKYVQRVFGAAEQRAAGVNPPVKSIAKFLSRIAGVDGVHQVVQSQLRNTDKVHLNYLLMLAETHQFKSLLEEYPVSRLNGSQLALLVKADPDINIPATLDIDQDPNWVAVAVNSNHVDSQLVAEKLVSLGLAAQVLAEADGLHARGVKMQLDDFVLDNIDSTTVISAAVAAHGTFVSSATAHTCLNHLVAKALADEGDIQDLTRVIKANAEFVDSLANQDAALRENLSILANDDRQNIIRSLNSLSLMRNAAPKAKTGNLEILKLNQLDLTIPLECSVNLLRARIPQTSLSTPEGLTLCEQLCEQICEALPHNDLSDDDVAKLSVLDSYLKSWGLVASEENKQDMPALLEALAKLDGAKLSPKLEILWELLDFENDSDSAYAVAYHAALAIANHGPLKSDKIQYSRDYFTKPSFKGALIAYFSAIDDNIQYEQMQRALIRDALAGKAGSKEYMLIDTSLIPVASTLELPLNSDADPVKIAQIIGTFGSKVSNLNELAFQSSNQIVEFSAITSISSISSLDDFLEYASSIPEDGTGMSLKAARKCLSLVQEQVNLDDSADTEFDLQLLLDRNDCIELPWICLQFAESSKLQLNLEGNIKLPSVLVSWLLFLRIDANVRQEISSQAWQSLFSWLGSNLQLLDPSDPDLTAQCDSENTELATEAKLSMRIIFLLSRQFPNRLREWYRDLRDKNYVKHVDRLFSTVITPMLLKSLQESLASTIDQDEVEVSVSEKQREIRARREVEDDFAIEITISIPEQFPCKTATTQIKNMAGVSEAKKRGWLLEARHNIQEKGILVALQSILQRVNNFLDGVEPCAICYMTVNDLSKLPNKSCNQCNNVYHSECLYKWFTSNQNNRLCPMCRTPI